MLTSLTGEYRIAAPVSNGDILEFRIIGDAAEAVLDDEITYKSPKEFLFPQAEKLMSFNGSGEVIDESQAPKTVIFGVKPCDLGALKVLAAVFTRGRFEDEGFKKRLENTVLVGVGCLAEKPGCFCGERGVQKDFSADCDLFLCDRGDCYSVEHFNEKGKRILEAAGIETAGLQHPRQRKAQEADNASLLEINADENDLFDKVNWERIPEKCLGCGTCTYICPTCHCFEFRDVCDKGVSTRYRCWDSCMYPKFTLHASGHNPRASKVERYRQRIMHKYLYVRQNFGYTACTGCGRCIRSCPAGMNIRTVVSDIIRTLEQS